MPFEVPRIATLNEGDKGFAGLCECGYATTGWPKAAIAAERIAQHQDEHASWVENQHDPDKWRLMEPLEEFRARHGLMQSTEDPNLAVFPPEGARIVKTTTSTEPAAEEEAPAEEPPTETTEEGS